MLLASETGCIVLYPTVDMPVHLDLFLGHLLTPRDFGHVDRNSRCIYVLSIIHTKSIQLEVPLNRLKGCLFLWRSKVEIRTFLCVNYCFSIVKEDLSLLSPRQALVFQELLGQE